MGDNDPSQPRHVQMMFILHVSYHQKHRATTTLEDTGTQLSYLLAMRSSTRCFLAGRNDIYLVGPC